VNPGADCHVISNDDDDATRQPLDVAVEEHYGWDDGTVLVCIPDRLAFVKAEGERFILHAP